MEHQSLFSGENTCIYLLSVESAQRMVNVKKYLVIILSVPNMNIRPQGYNTFFMLNTAEHEICPANKSQITRNFTFFLATQ